MVFVRVLLYVRANCPYCSLVEPRLRNALRSVGVELVTRHIEVPGAFIDLPDNVVIYNTETGEVVTRSAVDKRELLMTPILRIDAYGAYGDEFTILIPAIATYMVDETGKKVYNVRAAIDRYVENVTALVRELITEGRGGTAYIRHID